jgi:hypothetical protein
MISLKLLIVISLFSPFLFSFFFSFFFKKKINIIILFVNYFKVMV